jgi:hypothetical protein
VKYINPKNGSEYQCRLSVYSADDDDNSVLQNQAAWDNLDDDFNDEYEYEFDNDYDGECGDDYDVDFEEDFDFDPELGYDYD